jgi:hypothetical protein
MRKLSSTSLDNAFNILPSVTSPKEEKASFRDLSSTDHDKPATPRSDVRHISYQKAQGPVLVCVYVHGESKRERDREIYLQQRAYCCGEERRMRVVSSRIAVLKLGC